MIGFFDLLDRNFIRLDVLKEKTLNSFEESYCIFLRFEKRILLERGLEPLHLNGTSTSSLRVYQFHHPSGLQ